jgi:SAM-dependent methyltransferase
VLSRRAFLSCVAFIPALAQGDADDTVWAEYLVWLEGRVVGSTAGLDHYRQALLDLGLPEAEVERRMSIVSSRVLRRPEAMRLWFNSMYGADGAQGPDWPTPLVMEAVRELEPGSALDVSMGEGRNSLFLAGMGWDVTGFDVSDVALENARAKAAKAGVTLKTVRAGYQEFEFGHHRFDLIVMTCAYFPIREAEYVDRLLDSLRPGGLLVFQYGVLPKSAGNDGSASWLGVPEADELKRVFGTLQILRYEEIEEIADWQIGSRQRKARTVKMIARKN